MTETYLQGLDTIERSLAGCVLTIGNFDGVHLGHRRILRTCRQLAADLDTEVVALTFEPPPDQILRPSDVPLRIDPPAGKARHLLQAGADLVVEARSDPLLLQMAPEEFADQILVKHFAPRHVVEGRNFFYGLERSGNVETLAEAGQSRGFEVHVVDAVTADLRDGAKRISSTAIRLLIQLGRIEEANACLDREFTLFGRVVGGRGLGGQVLLPTANLEPGQQVLPADAVYAGRAVIDRHAWPAAISVGTNPTLGPTDRTVEAHLIGASGDLYGKEMAVHFIEYLRPQERYDSVDALREQIEKDVARVQRIVST